PVTLAPDCGGAGAGPGGNIVSRADRGVEDPSVRGPMPQAFAKIAKLPHVTLVSPYDPAGARQISRLGPEAGKIAYANVELPDKLNNADAQHIGKEIRQAPPHLHRLDTQLRRRRLPH